MKINDLLNEQIPPAAGTAGAAPTLGAAPAAAGAQTGVSPIQQAADRKKEIDERKAKINADITALTKQIADLRKELTTLK